MESNYKITVIDCITRKTIYKRVLSNVTEEKAVAFLDKAREVFTWKTGHYCDGNIREIKK